MPSDKLLILYGKTFLIQGYIAVKMKDQTAVKYIIITARNNKRKKQQWWK